MPFKSIAVFIGTSPSAEARVAFAARLACRHGAHLIGLYAVPSLMSGTAAESFVLGHTAVHEVIAQHRAREDEAIRLAKQSLSAICGRQGASFEFRPLVQAEFGDDLVLNSLHADLIIAGGHPGNGGLPNGWSAERLLLATGVPCILLPDSWNGSAAAEHVVVAWNASREARRAIADALPLLLTAKSVTVLLVDPEKNSRHGEEPGADIAHYLSRHGAKVAVEQVASNGAPVASVILDRAKQHAAGLVVIGAYSHARAAQMVLGGVTRSLLREAALPLLIAH
jgi:nucleotide-binding universal stress UspA family protein